jgi:hypothetical protein
VKTVDVQHISLKVFAREPAAVDLADAIPVFHRWIQESACEELLIDVADYRHVPAGPGVLLIGHEANYSLDCSSNRLGLLYNRKTTLPGSLEEKLAQAYGQAVAASKRLEEEPEFKGKLKFDTGDCEVIVNDRLLAPNNEATWVALRPALEAFFDGQFGAGAYSLERLGEPRERFRAGARRRRAQDGSC